MEHIHFPVVLIVLDGWGWREQTAHNPIAEARTPFYDRLLGEYPHALLEASGESVGLPAGQMGNSEIGHMVIGSGMPIPTDLVRIQHALEGGLFFTNEVLTNLFDHVIRNQSALHLVGLIGSGGVHAHQEHLVGILKAAKRYGVQRVFIHGFTDGRDTPPKSAARFVQQLEEQVSEIGLGAISTLCGRYYGMDRDKNAERIAKAENALFDSQGMRITERPSRTLESLYEQGIVDEHLEPIVFMSNEGSCTPIRNGDAVFFFNFRADRAVQLSRRIMDRCQGMNVAFATMTRYAEDVCCPVAYPSFVPPVTLASVLSQANVSQAHIAETEKYAHATYFLNGGREKPYPHEEHVLIESRKDVATHDLAPEMRAHEITDAAIDRIRRGVQFLFLNYANADMVGHTANHRATIRAIETLDAELLRLWKEVDEKGGVLCITADHGNAEQSHDHEIGVPHTAHTTNPVPFLLTKKGISIHDRGSLADIAPTILSLLHLPIPEEMQGSSLLN